MPSSDHNVTRNELVRLALSRLGVSEPTTDEIADGARALNSVVRKIDVEGRWLWAISNTPSSFTTVAGQQSYDVETDGLADDILDLDQSGVWIDRSATDREYIRVIDKSESLNSYENENTGEPYLIYLERQPLSTNNKVWLFPIPSGVYTIKYNYRRKIYDFDLVGDNPDFPQEWQICLEMQLASYLAPHYAATLQERQYLRAEADAELRKMQAANQDNAQQVTVQSEYF
jgi:hypothetical protein